MSKRNCLILTQYRNDSPYNDFLGKFYHFPATKLKNYLKEFKSLPIEVIYFEPEKLGKGEFYAYGKIEKAPFPDKKAADYYFVEIADYKPFSRPVYFKNDKKQIIESISNAKHYNPRNAVRKIDPQLFDELCLDGEIQLTFKADSHLVQVLGEQLIASETVGILELIKNAFDADASQCSVTIENIPNLTSIPESLYSFNEFEGPVIVIEDNGSGMSKEQIEGGWLRPASILKTSVKERLKTERDKALREKKLGAFNTFVKALKSSNKGRIPLGEKGVGRFATHRLGRKLLIKTKTKENNYEYLLKINWDDFNIIDGASKDLDSVPVILTRQKPSIDYGKSHSGTQLIMSGGRDGFELTESKIKEINRTILNLNSPNPNPSVKKQSFSASFNCPQIKNLEKESIYEKYDPVFKISGTIDEDGIFTYDFHFEPPNNIPLGSFNELKQVADLKTYDKKQWLIPGNDKKVWRTPSCGGFYIHIDSWIREIPWLGNTLEDKDFKKYLEDYGGISIFRDGINIFPAEWGSETDWLGLRQRQIKQARRMSYYHMIGNIEIDQSINIDLVDKTNREGLIKNRAFGDLTLLVTAVVEQIMENHYMGMREEYKKLSGDTTRDIATLQTYSQQSSKLVSNLSSSDYDVAVDPYKFFKDIKELGNASERKGRLVELSKSLKNLDKSLKLIEEIQDMLTEQAGFGLGIATALHEITKTTSNFYYGVLEVIKSGKFNRAKLDSLQETSRALESEIMRLSPLRALRNEAPINFKVSKSVEFVHSIFSRRFSELDISFSYNKDQDFVIQARFGALNQILTNLLDNSCYWLDDPRIKQKSIKICIHSENRFIIVADNGPDISDSILPYLFQPGYSLKYPPSGLGLYICKHYLNLMKKRGDIFLARNSERLPNLKGAQFLLDFSKVTGEENE